MTMIAFRAQHEHVDVMTDSLNYDPNGRTLGRVAKMELLPPELNAAVLTQGEGAFATMWKLDAARLAEDVPTFDDLNWVAPPRARHMWQAVQEDARRPLVDSIAFHIGYSPRRRRFVAVGFPSISDFEPIDLTDELYLMPSPTSDYPASPSTAEEWTDLAKQIRGERALAPITTGLKVFVGGVVTLTRLERDSVTKRVIHRFDDTGAEFREMVAGTSHPQGQFGPCPCGSGRLLAECHAPPPDAPCTCRNGKRYGDCCRVDPEQIRTAGRNDPCPCGSGAKVKTCCGAVPTAGAAGGLRSPTGRAR